LVYQMCCTIWTVYFLVFVYAPVAFTAHMQHLATVAISTQHFFRLLWDSPTCFFSLISLCNMHVYTSESLIPAFLMQGTCFVRAAVLRAGEGCFGLAIQNDRTVQVHAASPTIALDRGCKRELSGAVNVKGRSNAHKLAIPTIAKSNMPFIHFCFALKTNWIAKRYKWI
jgi:hypothetical protein